MQVAVYEDGGGGRNSSSQKTVLMTVPSSLLKQPAYRIVYTNLLYFFVMFLVPLAVLIILNGELIRVLRDKKAKRAQLLHGRTSSLVASVSAAADAGDDTRRCAASSYTPRVKY